MKISQGFVWVSHLSRVTTKISRLRTLLPPPKDLLASASRQCPSYLRALVSVLSKQRLETRFTVVQGFRFQHCQ